MLIFLFFSLSDTVAPRLAWPYYVSQSVAIEGYKAVKFSPQIPCSISQFLCCVGSFVDNVTKKCSLFVWCDGGNQPGPRLFSDTFNISAVDSGKLYWNAYDLSSPLHMVGAFWVGLWESDSFPTTVVDGVQSFGSSYSSDGINWDSVEGDYFYAVAVRFVQPQLHITPESLVFYIQADTNQSDTATLTVINGSALCNLSVDSIIWKEWWVLSAVPSAFGLSPMDSRNVEVVCGNVSGDGVYYDTLYIFSDDPYNNPCPVPLTLTVSGYGVEEFAEFRVKSLELRVHPNPFVRFTEIRGQGAEDRIEIYDMMGRLVEQKQKAKSKKQKIKVIGKDLPQGVYFVKVKGYKPVKIVKL